MIKPKYYNINITVFVADTDKSFKYNVPIHSTLRQIAIQLADDLNIDIFRSDISFRTRYNYCKLDLTTTLNQNKITTNNSELYANIDTISTKKLFWSPVTKKTNIAENEKLSSLDLINKFPIKITDIPTLGLNIEGTCNNKKCIYFQRNIFVPLGVGVFQLTDLLQKIKCPTCPYRDLDLNPSISILSFVFKGCYWKLKGKYNKNNEELYNLFEDWNLAEEEISSQFYCNIDQKFINSITVNVKGIHCFKQSNYQKYSFQGNSFNFMDDFVNFHH